MLFFRNFDDDRFRDAVMNCLTIRVDEILQESESALKRRSPVAERTFEGMPEGEMRVRQRHHTNPEKTLADGLTVTEVCSNRKIDNEGNKTPEGMKRIKVDVDLSLFVEDQQNSHNAYNEKDSDDHGIDYICERAR